jgi:hypothetical protein
MRGVILVVAYGVLPEATLPDAALTAGQARAGAALTVWQRLDECLLDFAPPSGKVVTARTAARNAPISATSLSLRRSSRLTVKK